MWSDVIRNIGWDLCLSANYFDSVCLDMMNITELLQPIPNFLMRGPKQWPFAFFTATIIVYLIAVYSVH